MLFKFCACHPESGLELGSCCGWGYTKATNGDRCPRGRLLWVPCPCFSDKPHTSVRQAKSTCYFLQSHGWFLCQGTGQGLDILQEESPPVTIGVAGWVLELLYPSGETILFYVVFSQDPALGTHVGPTFICCLLFLVSLPPLSSWCLGGLPLK